MRLFACQTFLVACVLVFADAQNANGGGSAEQGESTSNTGQDAFGNAGTMYGLLALTGANNNNLNKRNMYNAANAGAAGQGRLNGQGAMRPCPLTGCNPSMCPNGFLTDARGCQICQCRPVQPNPPCRPTGCNPSMCPNGFLTDARGCLTCQCRGSSIGSGFGSSTSNNRFGTGANTPRLGTNTMGGYGPGSNRGYGSSAGQPGSAMTRPAGNGFNAGSPVANRFGSGRNGNFMGSRPGNVGLSSNPNANSLITNHRNAHRLITNHRNANNQITNARNNLRNGMTGGFANNDDENNYKYRNPMNGGFRNDDQNSFRNGMNGAFGGNNQNLNNLRPGVYFKNDDTMRFRNNMGSGFKNDDMSAFVVNPTGGFGTGSNTGRSGTGPNTGNFGTGPSAGQSGNVHIGGFAGGRNPNVGGFPSGNQGSMQAGRQGNAQVGGFPSGNQGSNMQTGRQGGYGSGRGTNFGTGFPARSGFSGSNNFGNNNAGTQTRRCPYGTMCRPAPTRSSGYGSRSASLLGAALAAGNLMADMN